jgi:KUP system potassium uptake protein
VSEAEHNPGPAPAHAGKSQLRTLTLAALGVVYGDIGTSPLYVIRECFFSEGGAAPTPENVLGVLSLVFWALVLVIAVKYLSFVMHADNQGEGGILALLALAERRPRRKPGRPQLALLLALGGAALLYGDSMITPAISVLSAVEGLEVRLPGMEGWAEWIAVAILVGLFAAQRRGTQRIGALFGPITAVWFVSIACAAVPWIVRSPEVFSALNPSHGLRLLLDDTGPGVLILAAVFLCVTGGEALYADMGHFGRIPITLAWYGMVMPALLLSYFGQGAFLLHHAGPEPINPFWALLPAPLVFPMVGLATLATVIASQAVISGAFSLTAQAIQLGYLPRMPIVHTSSATEGQIYIPAVNIALAVACVALVLEFESSSALAAAYGIAVSGAMSATALIYLPTARLRYGLLAVAAMSLVFLTVDLTFLYSNSAKLLHGGAFPVLVGIALFAVMTTWKRGTELLNRHLNEFTLPLTSFIADVARSKPLRVPGTAVFMSGYPDGLPPALGHHFKHSKVLHERIVLLTITTEHVPLVPAGERVRIDALGEGFVRVIARFGFMQTPSVDDVLRPMSAAGERVTIDQASFFLGRVTVLTGQQRELARWRKKLFSLLHFSAQPAAGYYGIPPGRAVELGMQISL